jgi:hypothetical protein
MVTGLPPAEATCDATLLGHMHASPVAQFSPPSPRMMNYAVFEGLFRVGGLKSSEKLVPSNIEIDFKVGSVFSEQKRHEQ